MEEKKPCCLSLVEMSSRSSLAVHLPVETSFLSFSQEEMMFLKKKDQAFLPSNEGSTLD